MVRTLIIAVAFLFGSTAFSQTQTKVALLPALHNLHKVNTRYTYDSLQAYIKAVQPHVIAVEIRAEDIAADTVYLKNNYPYEMWMMRYWFPATVIEGFDWLGSDLEGKPIPARYWQEASHIKHLQKKLGTDSIYVQKLKSCALYTNQRMPVLQQASLKGIINSNDAILTREYYNCLNLQLQGSDYEELVTFYDTRNKKMQQRLTSIIEKHRGKTIVVLTGSDHYPYLQEHLRKLNVTLLKP